MSPGLCEDELWPTEQDIAEMSLMLYNPPVPLSWERRSLKRLPPGAMPVKLIGEGAANVVFEIGFPPDYQSAPTFQGESHPVGLFICIEAAVELTLESQGGY
jgi:hypothetical protein